MDSTVKEVTRFTCPVCCREHVLYSSAYNCCTPRGICMIAKERHRQIDKKGYTPEHDDTLPPLALIEKALERLSRAMCTDFMDGDEVIKNLVEAGALIAADADRVKRQIARATPEKE